MFAAQIAHNEQATAHHRDSGKKFRMTCMKSLSSIAAGSCFELMPVQLNFGTTIAATRA
jgi:hypothetical protein